MAQVGITKKYSEWSNSVDTNVERLMDDAAFTSAHPDDTLVIVGPPRLAQVTNQADGVYKEFAAVGMLQNITINQQKPFQPMMAIGSSRSFFVAGKAQGSAQVQRLFMNTDNLLRRLYSEHLEGTNKISTDVDGVTENPPGAGKDGAQNYLINLDSEFFMVPFGMGVIFKNKARSSIGGLYMELCVIPNFTVSVQSGTSMIMEGVSLFFDRVVPLPVDVNNAVLEEYKKIVRFSGQT